MAVALKQKVRFGAYEVDLHPGELSKNGTRLKFQPQPLQILAALLEGPRELVTREELQRRQSAPHHPQTNGKIERFHQTLKRRLSLLVYRSRFYRRPEDLRQNIAGFFTITTMSATTRASPMSRQPMSITDGAAPSCRSHPTAREGGETAHHPCDGWSTNSAVARHHIKANRERNTLASPSAQLGLNGSDDGKGWCN